jgi:hypothetical protein
MGGYLLFFQLQDPLTKDLDICFQTNWKIVLSSLLSMKAAFKAIICICDQKSFNNLVVAFQKKGILGDISMEYGFYPASK